MKNRRFKQEYPNYEFEIKNISETEVDWWMFGCRTPFIRNEIVNKTTNRIFYINVKKEDINNIWWWISITTTLALKGKIVAPSDVND